MLRMNYKLFLFLLTWPLYPILCKTNKISNEVILNFLKKFEYPTTLLDINPSNIKESLAQAAQFDCAYIILTWPKKKIPYELCNKTQPENVILLQRKSYSHDYILHLASCEHFDITFCTYPEEYTTETTHEFFLKNISFLADYTIITTKKKYISDLYIKNNSVIYNTLSQDNYIIIVEHKKSLLKRTTWRSKEKEIAPYQIKSNFEKKQFYCNRRNIYTNWIPGVNLETFKHAGGTYPSYQEIVNELENFKHCEHDDMYIGNFIIQGKKLKLIDFNDPQANYALKENPELQIAFCVKEFTKYVQRIP